MPKYQFKTIEEFRIKKGLARATLNASYHFTISHNSKVHEMRKAKNMSDKEICKKYFLDGKSVYECNQTTKIKTYRIRRYYKAFNKKYNQL